MTATTVAPTRYLRGASLAEKIRKDPAWAARKILSQNPWHKQEELLKKVFEHRLVEARGCVGSTKTFSAAMAALLWLLAFPKNGRVFSLAPSFRQVDTNLWGYIKLIARDAAEGGHPLLPPEDIKKIPYIEFGDGWYYKGFSTSDPGNVHGIHGPNDLLILDDAQGLKKDLFAELENMKAGGNTHVLMLYNPSNLSGETYDCNHRDRALWAHCKFSYWDLVEARKRGHQLTGALQEATVREWHKKFGKSSSFCRVKIDAEYPKEEKDTVIPLSYIEAAIVRKVPQLEGEAARAATFHGQDVARFGTDKSARCTLVGRQQLPIEYVQGNRTTETSGALIRAIRDQGGSAAVDVIGVGSGVVDECHAEGVEVMAVNVAEASSEIDEAGKPKFNNLRSELWWKMREHLDPENEDALALDPNDTELHGQLCSVKWKTDAKGRICVESKDDMIKRLGHSPDGGDALKLAIHCRSMGGGAGDPIAFA